MTVVALLSRGDGTDDLVDLGTVRGGGIGRDELLWVDVTGDDADDVERVEAALDPGTPAVEALRSQIDELGVRVLPGGLTEVVTRPPGRDDDRTPAPIRVLLGEGWVVTQHAGPSPALDAYRERIQEWLERAVDRLDNAALVGDGDLLDDLVRARRHITRLRRVLVENREVFAELSRPDFVARLSPQEVRALQHVGARLDRAAEAIGHVREMLVGTFDVHMTRTAQRTNDVMRVLTWASVILLPAVVVAGVMGMNFDVPLFRDANLFYVIVGGMVATALATLLVARWRRWL
jgi:magnesium transporter